MCGISGILNFIPQSVNQQELITMNSFLKERGPDAEGLWLGNQIGLAHKRLSIVDLSPLGKQPMEDINQQCVITFNGEIYNFLVLKKELLNKGVKFRSTSDTEVILEGYLHWGIEGVLKRMEGMFAFVLFDKNKNVAFACRDRFGQKPLYYFRDKKRFKFSSDIRSISATEDNLSLDYESIDYYFTELSVPQPKTIWQEIKQVRPAHYLRIDLPNKKVIQSCYWSLDYTQKLNVSLQEAEFLVEEALTKAVIKRQHGDVPIGSFLSGGVDSGLVTALLAQNSSERIKTFTVGLNYAKYDESKEAQQLAERYNTDHTEIIIEAKDLTKVIENLIDYCGEPFADSSLIPSYYICESISDKVKVALSGDGGDEFFGGYFNYAHAYQADQYNLATAGYSPFTKRLALVSNKVKFRAGISTNNVGTASTYADFSGARRLYREMGFSDKERDLLYTPAFKQQINHFSANFLQSVWDKSNKVSLTDNLLEASLQTRLLNDYLVKVDRASMINSLEVRSPFLDHPLAEVSAKISCDYHLKNGVTKYLTKQLAKKYVDQDILKRPKKGFGIPMKEWLRNDLKSFVYETIKENNLGKLGIVDANYVDRIFKEHEANKSDYTNKIWAISCLERWLTKK